MAGFEVDDLRLWTVLEQAPIEPAEIAAAVGLLGGTSVIGSPAIFGTAGSANTMSITIDTIRYRDTFAVNTIPTATVSLALGRRMDNFNIISAVHTCQDLLRSRISVSIYAQGTLRNFFTNNPELESPSPWTGKPFRIFKGRTAGCAYQRTTAGAEFTLQLTHWLDDLTKSSPVSSLTNPQNPMLFAFPAVFQLRGSPVSTMPAGASGSSNLPNSSDVTLDNITQDFWGRALLPWLQKACATDIMLLSTAGRSVANILGIGSILNTSNQDALAALALFEPLVTGGNYLDGVPLKMNTSGMTFGAGILTGQIQRHIANRTFQQLGSKTTWDILLELAAEFSFGIIPLVEKALVVPLIRGIRQTTQTQDPETDVFLSRSEFNDLRWTKATPRTLRAVAVVGNVNYYAGQPTTLDASGQVVNGINWGTQNVGGFYQGANTGQVLWINAPPWMSGIPWSQVSSQTLRATASAANPGTGISITSIVNAATSFAAGLINPATAAADNGTVMDRYAKAVYANENLAHRQGDIAGKVRFDIAPGSSIQIEGAGEQFVSINGGDQLADSQFATVLEVATYIDAEAPSAATGYHLTHLRTLAENGLDQTSIAVHPLWSIPWSGCELIPIT